MLDKGLLRLMTRWFFRNYWIIERLTLLNGGLNASHQDLKLSCGRYLETLIQRSYWSYYTDSTKWATCFVLALQVDLFRAYVGIFHDSCHFRGKKFADVESTKLLSCADERWKLTKKWNSNLWDVLVNCKYLLVPISDLSSLCFRQTMFSHRIFSNRDKCLQVFFIAFVKMNICVKLSERVCEKSRKIFVIPSWKIWILL